MASEKKSQSGIECEEWYILSLTEVSSSFGISKETVIEIMDEGIVSAKKSGHDELLFDTEAVRRIRTVLRLHRDLGVNLAGAGLALELLNEIEHLRSLLKK